MTPTAVWIVVAIAVVAAVVVVLIRRQHTSGNVPAIHDESARLADEEGEAQLVERDPEIHWSDQFGARAGTLDDDGRLRLIFDLGLIHAAWVVPVLQQAYVEERRPSHRRAALQALAACRHPDALATLESAALAQDEAERTVAVAALRAR